MFKKWNKRSLNEGKTRLGRQETSRGGLYDAWERYGRRGGVANFP